MLEFINILSIYIHGSIYTLLCLSIGTPKTINFPFVPNGKLVVLGVRIFKHIRVIIICLIMFPKPSEHSHQKKTVSGLTCPNFALVPH